MQDNLDTQLQQLLAKYDNADLSGLAIGDKKNPDVALGRTGVEHTLNQIKILLSQKGYNKKQIKAFLHDRRDQKLFAQLKSDADYKTNKLINEMIPLSEKYNKNPDNDTAGLLLELSKKFQSVSGMTVSQWCRENSR